MVLWMSGLIVFMVFIPILMDHDGYKPWKCFSVGLFFGVLLVLYVYWQTFIVNTPVFV